MRTKDIEDIFYKYGKIKYIDLKNRKGPPYAFVEFEDSLDAKDAVESRDGYNFDGHKLRVEFQKGARGGGGGGAGRGMSERSSRSGPPTRRSENRCIITGLPTTGSWQDLKDHMREAGNVCYADVYKDGTGVVEFIRYEDMKYAIKHLDDTKFRSHEVCSPFRVLLAPLHTTHASATAATTLTTWPDLDPLALHIVSPHVDPTSSGIDRRSPFLSAVDQSFLRASY